MDKEIEAALIIAASNLAASHNKGASNLDFAVWISTFQQMLQAVHKGYNNHKAKS